jgi:hypothetical protein
MNHILKQNPEMYSKQKKKPHKLFFLKIKNFRILDVLSLYRHFVVAGFIGMKYPSFVAVTS